MYIFEEELSQYVDELIDDGDLERGTKECGIALLAADIGYDYLTPKQKYVFDRLVLPLVNDLMKRDYYIERMNSVAD